MTSERVEYDKKYVDDREVLLTWHVVVQNQSDKVLYGIILILRYNNTLYHDIVEYYHYNLKVPFVWLYSSIITLCHYQCYFCFTLCCFSNTECQFTVLVLPFVITKTCHYNIIIIITHVIIIVLPFVITVHVLPHVVIVLSLSLQNIIWSHA